MPLKITQRPEHEVPKPSRAGKVNEDLVAVKNEMMKLGQGMVLEIEAGSEKAIRGAKALITRAAKELGTPWRHWHFGSKVFARPAEGTQRRRGRAKKNQ